MKLRASLAAVVALVVVVAPEATGKGAGRIPQATSNIPGCAPQCLPPGGTAPGSLPTGTYQTKYFFAKQMKLSFARGWFSEEDSTGEFAAYAKKNPNSRVVFWEDVYTTKPGSLQRVGPPRRTAASLLAWLQGNPNLTVSKPTSGRIGAIRARVVDIGVADDAVNDDPTCPAKAVRQLPRVPAVGRAIRDCREMDQPFLPGGCSLRRQTASVRGRNRSGRHSPAQGVPAGRQEGHRVCSRPSRLPPDS